ncbi:MAG TPA: hypothetical protein VGO98_02660 [Candidatus Saccharimonadales bacterium]|nr:hypothetical protein [Candidatus Saccharimonadales bacterium]
MFERTLDHTRDRQDAPRQSPSMHQTPFYVFPTLENNKLLTLPDGKLINGLRNAVTSHERNAIQIAQTHKLAVKGLGTLTIPKETKHDGYGFVVEPAWKTTIPAYADFTAESAIGQHDHELELHTYQALLEQLHDQPERRNELAFVRAFGDFVLNRHA